MNRGNIDHGNAERHPIPGKWRTAAARIPAGLGFSLR
jgi:hypothetical protein